MERIKNFTKNNGSYVLANIIILIYLYLTDNNTNIDFISSLGGVAAGLISARTIDEIIYNYLN